MCIIQFKFINILVHVKIKISLFIEGTKGITIDKIFKIQNRNSIEVSKISLP